MKLEVQITLKKIKVLMKFNSKKEMKENLEKTKEPSSIAFEIEEDEMEDDEEEEEYEEDETYFQKFHENMKKNIVEEFHPEMKYHNYNEIETLTTIIRDSNGRIIDPNHQTTPFITKYEKARVLGERAKQINAGAAPMIEIEDDIIDGYLIAQKEFEQKKIPFIIKRPVSGNHIEYWKLSDLEIL
jgi:DNA-directed RNA polymerase I, II, and III subunit RPABC2